MLLKKVFFLYCFQYQVFLYWKDQSYGYYLLCVYIEMNLNLHIIFFVCSLILTFKRLPVCPTYDALQSLQLILYTTFTLSQVLVFVFAQFYNII